MKEELHQAELIEERLEVMTDDLVDGLRIGKRVTMKMSHIQKKDVPFTNGKMRIGGQRHA